MQEEDAAAVAAAAGYCHFSLDFHTRPRLTQLYVDKRCPLVFTG